MKMTYDPSADILYVALRDTPLATSCDLEPGVTAEYDTDGQLAGLEILDALERIDILNNDEVAPVALTRLIDARQQQAGRRVS